MAFLAGVRDGVAFHQVFAVDGLRLDEAALEIGVDRASGFDRGVARVDGPRYPK